MLCQVHVLRFVNRFCFEAWIDVNFPLSNILGFGNWKLKICVFIYLKKSHIWIMVDSVIQSNSINSLLFVLFLLSLFFYISNMLSLKSWRTCIVAIIYHCRMRSLSVAIAHTVVPFSFISISCLISWNPTLAVMPRSSQFWFLLQKIKHLVEFVLNAFKFLNAFKYLFCAISGTPCTEFVFFIVFISMLLLIALFWISRILHQFRRYYRISFCYLIPAQFA